MSPINNTTLTNNNPLDTLLVQQLENIIRDERALATKYPSLGSAIDTEETRAAFSDELNQLTRRADRLQRLMDAMEVVGYTQPTPHEFVPKFVV